MLLLLLTAASCNFFGAQFELDKKTKRRLMLAFFPYMLSRRSWDITKGSLYLLFLSIISCTQLVPFTASFFLFACIQNIYAPTTSLCIQQQGTAYEKNDLQRIFTLSNDQRRIIVGFVNKRLSRDESGTCKKKNSQNLDSP